MLAELVVRNFAVIEEVRVSFSPGLNVLTGETGAGKSLIIDAVGALLGSRLDADAVRAGAASAQVEGVFLLSEEVRERLASALEEAGVPLDDELVVVREVSQAGRNLARANGRTVPLSLLREVGRRLVDVHGQTEHLSLLDRRLHLDCLDAFGGLLAQRRQVASAAARVRSLRRRLEELSRDEREAARERDLLEFQVREIEAAALRPGEEEELREERERLVHAQALQEAAQTAYHALYAAEGYSASDALARAQASLQSVARLDPRLRDILSALEGVAAEVEEAARSLRAYAAQTEHDPQRLEQVEERLEAIARLRRKYGDSIEQVLDYARRARERLSLLVSGEEERQRLESELRQAEEEAGALASALSRSRREAAAALEQAVARELADLGMGHVAFRVELEQEEDGSGLPVDGRRLAFDESGVDRAEFLVATNPGEPLRPLAKVASGGEMSRFLLALKGALAMADPVPTLIFDEIDVGIGGRSAEVVGRKLWRLARRHQVLCVTHLPQIAAYADAHYRVSKEVVLGRAFSQVQALSEEERLRELAAMLGGPRPSERLLATAREFLSRARHWQREQET
ncbi:MAG TPA: DNA repair protein RecN [Dehalococcoidia bacterium]|nr:DNA repair protein RecN [Dehalococcoidia bacterium]